MAMPLPAVWGTNYGSVFQDYFDAAMAESVDLSVGVSQAWSDWIDQSATGIETAPPFSGSTGALVPANFFPSFSPVATPVITATTLASAWMAWYGSIVWPLIPPVPPFSVIASIVSSPSGMIAAHAVLLAGLTAEFAVMSGPNDGLEVKGLAIGTLFYTACISAGVQISGLGIGGPPPPLVIPISPVI